MPAMEKWLNSGDCDIRWVMLENLKKNRLVRMDPGWVTHWQSVLVGAEDLLAAGGETRVEPKRSNGAAVTGKEYGTS
jgi:hypothetical protein